MVACCPWCNVIFQDEVVEMRHHCGKGRSSMKIAPRTHHIKLSTADAQQLQITRLSIIHNASQILKKVELIK